MKRNSKKKSKIKYKWEHLTPSTPRSEIPKTLLKEAKKHGGIVLKRTNHVEDVLHYNRHLDRKHAHALPPGKRLSRNGHVYYEYRINRSDRRKYL